MPPKGKSKTPKAPSGTASTVEKDLAKLGVPPKSTTTSALPSGSTPLVKDHIDTSSIDKKTKKEAASGDPKSKVKSEANEKAPEDQDVNMEDSIESKADEPKGHSYGNTKKRAASDDEGGVAGQDGKKDTKRKKDAYVLQGKVAHADAAAKVDANPPLDQLMKAQSTLWGSSTKKKSGKGKQGDKLDGVEKGECVVYWIRMNDLRVVDNRALQLASNFAQDNGLPLIALFVLTPREWKTHERSSRRIDFVLRNLRVMKSLFKEKNIPLYIHNHPNNRFLLPKSLVTKIFPSLNAHHIFGNMEYEVDELRRDLEIVQLGHDAEQQIKAVFVHDRLAVPPGMCKSGKGTQYAVYSPWQRQWATVLAANPELLEESPEPADNDKSIYNHPVFSKVFDHEIPDSVDGFECTDKETMKKIWPEGTDNAIKVLDRFLYSTARVSDLGLVDPLQQGLTGPSAAASSTQDTIEVPDSDDEAQGPSRIKNYAEGRNSADANTSSRMSPYLTSGVISARMVLNKAKKLTKGKLVSGRDTGIGMWVMEVAWRDFYNHVMAAFPRVSMGRPYIEKTSDVQWEVRQDHLERWKKGLTGFPIVDAAMRQANNHGWMHNRPRMISAFFLVKDLMLDWRLGEAYFMQQFIDGDLASNNLGWQFCASTGVDPAPYFRIFNPTTQSEKASPDGEYIRYWVPELKNVKGSAIHDPFHKLSPLEFKKLGYPEPMVDHSKARERALFRYKNVGQKEDKPFL